LKLVVIESPLSAPSRAGIERNKDYARECMRDSLRRGEAPYASHLLFDQPGILDDTIPLQREQGMMAGFAWGGHAERVAFYVDLGVSDGMIRGFERAIQTDADIVVRSLKTREELFVPIDFELPGTFAEEEAKKRNLSNLHKAAASIVAS
jgi:hypothetical protein